MILLKLLKPIWICSKLTLFSFLEEEEDDSLPQPAGVKLRRAGYYTIPSMSELSTMVDTEGNLNVENFTIGRQGYGNIFFPGITNIKGMNFDDIVFFRHKEVIVYPDDSKKPELGQGLNKKAQVTLDKVRRILNSVFDMYFLLSFSLNHQNLKVLCENP